jgi:hypothetical protein
LSFCYSTLTSMYVLSIHCQSSKITTIERDISISGLSHYFPPIVGRKKSFKRTPVCGEVRDDLGSLSDPTERSPHLPDAPPVMKYTFSNTFCHTVCIYVIPHDFGSPHDYIYLSLMFYYIFIFWLACLWYMILVVVLCGVAMNCFVAFISFFYFGIWL